MQARGQLEALKMASEQLQTSTDFMTLLQAVLALGNHLNKGTMRGAASGEFLAGTGQGCDRA